MSRSKNPYQSPECPAGAASTETGLRKRAGRSLHVAMGMLLVPALYNYWGLAFAFALIWLFGLAALEWMARLVRRVLAHETIESEWLAVLHKRLAWAPYLAIPGAALWAVWVFGFYQMRINYQSLSWAVGVPAHLLAACWYLPLVHGWYQLARWPVRSASA